MVSEVTVPKNSKETLLQVEKVTVQKLVMVFWTVTFKVNKYWAYANLLYLIKNIMWDGFY